MQSHLAQVAMFSIKNKIWQNTDFKRVRYQFLPEQHIPLQISCAYATHSILS